MPGTQGLSQASVARRWSLCLILALPILPGAVPAHAARKPKIPEIPRKTVVVLIDRKGATDSLLAGFRRPFFLKELLLERKRDGRDAIPNVLRLVPCRSCVPDSADVFTVLGDSLPRSRNQVDEVVWVRNPSFGSVTLDNVGGRPEGAIDPWMMRVPVAIWDPKSLNGPPEWTEKTVIWRERPATPARASEIHGWMAGMCAMQVIYRRLGLVKENELVFESRGRNR